MSPLLFLPASALFLLALLCREPRPRCPRWYSAACLGAGIG